MPKKRRDAHGFFRPDNTNNGLLIAPSTLAAAARRSCRVPTIRTKGGSVHAFARAPFDLPGPSHGKTPPLKAKGAAPKLCHQLRRPHGSV